MSNGCCVYGGAEGMVSGGEGRVVVATEVASGSSTSAKGCWEDDGPANMDD